MLEKFTVHIDQLQMSLKITSNKNLLFLHNTWSLTWCVFLSFWLIMLFTYDSSFPLPPPTSPATSRAWPQLHQEEVARRQWAGEPHRWCFLPRALTCRQLLPVQRVAQWDGRRYPRYHLTPCHPLIKHHLHPHTWLIPPSDCVCSPHFLPRFSCCHWWCGDKPPPKPPPPPIHCPRSSACLGGNKWSCTKTKLDLMTDLHNDNKCLKTMIIYHLLSKKLCYCYRYCC